MNITDIKNMFRRLDEMIVAFIDIAKSLERIANTMEKESK